jgi:hypothetical protein
MIVVRSSGSFTFRILLALLLAATQISIVAYSARLSHDMFRTVLSGVITKENAKLSLDMVPLPMEPPRNPLATLQSRAGLFRRRLLVGENARTIGTNQTTTSSTTFLTMDPFRSLFRGGASGVGVAGSIAASSWHTLLVELFCRFANFVGQTKTRCFLLLVFSVVVESYATTLSKQAKDTGNALLFGRACLVYLFWYVSHHFHWCVAGKR